MKKATFCALLCITMAGCTTLSPAQRAQMQKDLDTHRPTCKNAAQCEAMWAAARDWVASNCAMKIQNITDSYIETYNPAPYSPGIACQVTKDPVPSGGYVLHMKVWCDNLLGCQPNAMTAMQAFESSVNSTTAQFEHSATQ